MKCPNCQKSFDGGVKCPHCDVDTVLYIGTVRLSEKLHNHGLERLKAGDIYHGIQALSKSISINKNNVPSRNLLGLALYEIGHIGEAIRQWEISQSMLGEGNPAEKYIASLYKNTRKLEALADSIDMFNQALAHIKQKSDDLAIIQLRKALEINPHFVDALNLLTLCYLIQNDRDRANAAAERVLSLDMLNPIALNYYSIINPGKSRPARNAPPPVRQQQPVVPKGPYKPVTIDKKPRRFHLAELFTFLIGVGLTVAVAYFVLVPIFERGLEAEEAAAEAVRGELNNANAQMQRLLTDFAASNELPTEDERTIEQRISDLSAVLQNRSETISGHEATIIGLEADLNLKRRVNDVNNAYFLFREGELRQAFDILHGFRQEGLEPEVRNRINYVLDDARPRLALEYYNAGLASFNATPRDRHMALQHLQDAHSFMRPEDDERRFNRMLFMLGELHYYNGDLAEAYVYLSELRERAPGLPAASAQPNFTGGEQSRFNSMLANIDLQIN